MRRVTWGALAFIVIVTLSQVGSWLWAELKSDQIDRYEVIEVVSYKGTSNHAWCSTIIMPIAQQPRSLSG